MVGSLWTGISGLAGQQTALDNESNNIANVNTIGYKAGRTSFADQMYQNKIGKGTQVLDAEKLFTQGNLKLTGVNYDVALSGDGFFTVQKPSIGGTAETFYTRAGNFRMGDTGTLQDSVGNEVVGWAMSIPPSTTTTDPNVSKFNNDYTKLLATSIISYSNAVETITAKATDYTETAQSDDPAVFSGWGMKSKYGKIADVEELIKAYTSALNNLKSDPNSSSSSSTTQLSHVDLPGGNGLTDTATWDNGVISADGDEVYIYIDGNRISQSYITTSATDTLSTQAASYIATMKAFADKISELPGIKAYVAKDATTTYAPSTDDIDVVQGILRVESIVPGASFTISSVGMVSGGADKPGEYKVDREAELGTGVAAVNNARDALSEAITGKQTDVYTPTDLGLPTTVDNMNYTYQIKIYSKSAEEYVTVPASPLKIDDVDTAETGSTATGINKIIEAINDDPDLSKYVEATNVNGNMVVRTKDSNFDVEFSGELLGPQAEVQTLAISGPATAAGTVNFLGTTITVPNGTTATALGNLIVADKEDIIKDWNDANSAREIEDIVASNGVLTVTYKSTEGAAVGLLIDGTDMDASGTAGITFADSTQDIAGGDSGKEIRRNALYSGREGAGAEFLELKTRIDQTSSKDALQLRLDKLNISDSAFGDYSVDDTGLITMSQDGAMFAVGQIAIARFITNRGLEPVGNNLLRSTLASGDPIYNTNNDKAAEVKANTLELSTADLSESLVNLMVFQRAFEANAKSITTADTILNTLIQLKR